MTREETARLIRSAQTGDGEALDLLVRENMGLCKSLALRFRDRGTEYEDLVQLAAIGMIKAIRSFDFSYETAFSTYAVPLILGEIRRFLRDDGSIKVGRGVKKLGYDAMKRREEFLQREGREPHISELAALCGVTREELAFSLDAITPTRSLDERLGEDGDGPALEERLADREDGIGRLTDSIALSEAIRELPKEERRLIYLRFVKELSQEQTGRLMGMTQVKVSREEKKIMARLRQKL